MEQLEVDPMSGKNTQHPEQQVVLDSTRQGGVVITGKFMLTTIFGAVAELEREYILQRQREGLGILKDNEGHKR